MQGVSKAKNFTVYTNIWGVTPCSQVGDYKYLEYKGGGTA
jgi:hypothetical protein